MLGVILVAGLPEPLGCALREVPEAGLAFEAILAVEAIAELSVKIRAVTPWHKEVMAVGCLSHEFSSSFCKTERGRIPQLQQREKGKGRPDRNCTSPTRGYRWN